jgi:hypothetical protein
MFCAESCTLQWALHSATVHERTTEPRKVVTALCPFYKFLTLLEQVKLMGRAAGDRLTPELARASISVIGLHATPTGAVTTIPVLAK